MDVNRKRFNRIRCFDRANKYPAIAAEERPAARDIEVTRNVSVAGEIPREPFQRGGEAEIQCGRPKVTGHIAHDLDGLFSQMCGQLLQPFARRQQFGCDAMQLALALFSVSRRAVVVITVVVVMFLPFLALPVAMTVVISVPIPAYDNRCLGDHYRGRHADIDVYVDGIGHAG